MLRPFLTLGLLLPLTDVLAQATPPHTLTGQVLDQTTHQPIPGATVLLRDLQQVAATAPDGTFTLTNLPPGHFLLEIRSLGYRTAAQTVDTEAAAPVAIALGTAAQEL